MFNKAESKARPKAKPSAAQKSEQTTFVAVGAKLAGELSFSGPTSLACEARGEVDCDAYLVIEEAGTVVATVRGPTIVVHGRVAGHIIATESIVLTSSAMVAGDLTAPAIKIEDGAQLKGQMNIVRDGVAEESAGFLEGPPVHARVGSQMAGAGEDERHEGADNVTPLQGAAAAVQ